jgi:hypothetical protein
MAHLSSQNLPTAENGMDPSYYIKFHPMLFSFPADGPKGGVVKCTFNVDESS